MQVVGAGTWDIEESCGDIGAGAGALKEIRDIRGGELTLDGLRVPYIRGAELT